MILNKTDILTKITDMKNACLTRCLDCNSPSLTPPSQSVTLSQTAYTNSFNNLTTAVNNYYSSASSDILYDIIMLDFIKEQTKNIIMNPPNISYPTTGLPVGANDYWNLYGAYSVLSSIMGYDNDYFFNQFGCILTTGITTISVIESVVTTINNSTASDTDNQTAFLNWLRYTPRRNTFINIVEKQELVSIDSMTKEEVGQVIYIDKHALEIIQSFNFDLYIPAYIQS